MADPVSAQKVKSLDASCAHAIATPQKARCRRSRAVTTLRHCLACRAWSRTRAGRAATDALADIPPLRDEIERLDAMLSRTRLRHQDLTAAARATLAADAEGEPDPLYYLRDELGAERSEPQPW
jgi:hypothetical protein